MTDEALVDRVQRGDDAAFRTLYERYRDPLFRFGYRLTGSVETAEDLLHDSFVGLFRGSYDASRGVLKTWLYGAVRNLARKHYRDAGREDLTDDADRTSDRAPGPLEELIARQTAQQVSSAVLALPSLQREVLVLFEYQELALEQISEIVGADLGAVKSRLHRARERLRRTLTAAHECSKESAR